MIAWLKLVPAWGWWLLALLAVGGGQQLRILSLQADLHTERQAVADRTGERDACRATRASLEAGVEEQNRELAALRRAAEQRQERARQVQAAGRQQAQADYQAANRLQQERTGGDACAAAESIIDQELGL